MKYKQKTIKIPLCESCEKELRPENPHCEFEDGYYCGDCALKLGKINLEKYKKVFLYFISDDLKKDLTLTDILEQISIKEGK